MHKKRSMADCPLEKGNFLLEYITEMWNSGWLDEYSDEHFLIRAIENRLTDFYGKVQYSLDNTLLYPHVINDNNFTMNFLANFSTKMQGIEEKIGKRNIERFVKDQLSAGKDHYSEEQFFRAISEISIITYFCHTKWKDIVYEPQINGKKNPEVRFISQNDTIIDIEVKTPGFTQSNLGTEKLIPTVLLNEDGLELIEQHCKANNMKCIMPRVGKLKDYINSAAEKFAIPESNKHINILFINWSYSEFAPDSYQEAYSLLVNPVNGIIRNKEIGMKMGIREDAYDKISAIVVYSDSLNGLVYLDLRYIWIDHKFRMIALRDDIDFFRLTGMNADRDPDRVVCVLGDEPVDTTPNSPTLQAIHIIEENMLT